MNETQLWYCDSCDKTINIDSESNHFISETHKRKEEYGIVVNEYETFKSKNNEIHYVSDNVIEEYNDKSFHTIEARCVFDINFTINKNNEEIISTNTHGYKCFSSEMYGKSKKIKNAQKNRLQSDEKVILLIKID